MADEKDIAEDTPPEGGGSKKKLLILVGAAVLVLAIGGTAAFFLLGGGAPAETVAGEIEGDAEGGLAEEGVVDEDAFDEEAEEEGEPMYHALSPTFVVNLPPGGPAGMLQIAIEVMTRTPSVVETLEANDPMIRHHVINLLERQQAEELLTVNGKEALQKAIHDTLSERLKALREPGKIRGVFFTQFVMQ
jgi:flagellar FliL protein